MAGLPLALLCVVLTYYWLHLYALLFLVIMPYVLLENIVFRKNFRLYISPDAFEIYSGAWGRASTIAQWYKIQYVQVKQSIYQQRHHLATVVLHTAGGQIRIPYIEVELARAVSNYALYQVEQSNRSWM